MVDVIVVTFNRITYFKTFVEMLYLSTKVPFRLIVVDNGSTDGSRELIIKLEKKGIIWKHIFTESNLPLAQAFSEALPLCESEFVLTVADDMVPSLFKEFDWLELFLAKIQQDETVGSINFVASRCAFQSFNRRNRPRIEARIKEEGGERLELFNRLERIIYDR